MMFPVSTRDAQHILMQHLAVHCFSLQNLTTTSTTMCQTRLIMGSLRYEIYHSSLAVSPRLMTEHGKSVQKYCRLRLVPDTTRNQRAYSVRYVYSTHYTFDSCGHVNRITPGFQTAITGIKLQIETDEKKLADSVAESLPPVRFYLIQ